MINFGSTKLLETITNMNIKGILSNPWFIGIAVTIIGGLILYFVLGIGKKSTIEKYIIPQETQNQSDSQTKNEPFVVPVPNGGKAVYFGDYDYSCRKIDIPKNVETVSLLISLNKIWKKPSPNEIQIISLPNVVSIFLQNDQLILKAIERDGRFQLLTSNAPENWYINEWYDLAVEINNRKSLKMYINQTLISEQKISDLDMSFDEVASVCLGSRSNKDMPFLVDNLLVGTDPVENHLYHFKQIVEDQEESKRSILDFLNKLKEFFKI